MLDLPKNHGLLHGTFINYTALEGHLVFSTLATPFLFSRYYLRSSPVRAGLLVIQPTAPRVFEHHFVYIHFGCLVWICMVWNVDPKLPCKRDVSKVVKNAEKWKTKSATATDNWQIESFCCYVVLVVNCFVLAHLQQWTSFQELRWIPIGWNVWCFPIFVQEGSTSTNLLSRERKGLSSTAGPGLDDPKEV